MFRRAVFALLLATGLLPALAGPGLAQSNDPSFRVVNNTSMIVNELYASPASQRDWGRDRLGRDVIRPGANYIVRLPAGECVYDIRVVYQGGSSEERRGINTCNLTDLTLPLATAQLGTQPPQRQQPPAPPPPPPQQPATPPAASGPATGNPSFNLINQSSRVIEEFYASLSTQPNWGEDRLGDATVAPGASFAVRLPEGPCVYDIKVVFQGGQSTERRNVNTCALENYVVR
jgi:hypothetical protein